MSHPVQHFCLILPGQESSFLQMEGAFHQSLKPAAGIELYLFRDALRSWWNVERCHAAEAQLYRSQTDSTKDPLLDDSHEKQYRRIRQFERSNRLSFHKSIQKLAEIQTEVRYRLQAFPPQQGTKAADQMPHSLSVLTNTDKVLTGALRTGKTAIVKKSVVTVAPQPPAAAAEGEEELKRVVNSTIPPTGSEAVQPEIH